MAMHTYNRKVILFYVHTYILMLVQYIIIHSFYTVHSVILRTKPSFFVECSWIVLDLRVNRYIHTHTHTHIHTPSSIPHTHSIHTHTHLPA